MPATPADGLLLRLQGLHVRTNGMQTELPRPHAPRRSPTRTPSSWLPLRATLNLLVHQQLEDGHWAGMDHCDHLSLTYALLLLQCHMAKTDPTLSELNRSIHLAVTYMETHIGQYAGVSETQLVTQAMCLLILARHAANGANSDAKASRSMLLAQQLAKGLSVARGTQTHSVQAGHWLHLALEAFSRCSERLGNAGGPVFHMAKEDTQASAVALIELLLGDRNNALAHANNHRIINFNNDTWLSIAAIENLSMDITPDLYRDKFREHWRKSSRALLASLSHRIIWPEQAMFLPPAQREQSAFFTNAPSREPVTDCLVAAQLFTTVIALSHVLNA